ncbi:hypothetical protein J2S74_001653 [Evansella vedderi]|uniref:DUF3918 domain-containing protein n=1 Tax=Evansella vedderi TaxID=38282 RepID=A0ABT9ZSS6_9BACI|nr:hypothetical protein [Evansella vedderi]
MRMLVSLAAIGAGAYAYRNMDKRTKKQIRKAFQQFQR